MVKIVRIILIRSNYSVLGDLANVTVNALEGKGWNVALNEGEKRHQKIYLCTSCRIIYYGINSKRHLQYESWFS